MIAENLPSLLNSVESCPPSPTKRGRWWSMAPLFPMILASLLVSVSDTAESAERAETLSRAPIIDMTSLHKVSAHVSVVGDRRIPLVPNIGIIEGTKAILVVDTGLGPTNGKQLLSAARHIAGSRRIFLTTTHFHPEHSFGASAFPEGSWIVNSGQAEELIEKGAGYLELFRKIGPEAEAALEDTKLVQPAVVYKRRYTLDLGGVKVDMREMPAHTRGDQVIFVPDGRTLFTGDLAETRFFPVLIDADSNSQRWIKVLRQLSALRPAVIVPGHGEISDGRLLSDVRGMLEWMRDMIHERLSATSWNNEMAAEVESAALNRYPDWENAQYLGYDITAFLNEARAEKTKKNQMSR